MKTEKAIKILLVQRDKLLDKKIYKDENWVFQTASYIKDFFGEHSPEYKFIGTYTFTALAHNQMSKEEKQLLFKDKENKAVIFLNNCIETIQNKGLFKPPKKNFLQRIGNSAVWTIIGILVPALFSVGFLIGQYFTDTKNIDLKTQVKQLQDSLNIVKSKNKNLNDL